MPQFLGLVASTGQNACSLKRTIWNVLDTGKLICSPASRKCDGKSNSLIRRCNGNLHRYVLRRVFDNYAEFEALHGEPPEMKELPYPRVSNARHLPERIKRRLGIGASEDARKIA